jgi:Uncharacterized conserved protein (DUF2303)
MNPEQTEIVNIAQTMRDTVEDLSGFEFVSSPDDGHPLAPTIVTVTKGRDTKNLTDEIRRAAAYHKPHRRTGTARHNTLASLIDWSNRFKGDSSILYADPNRQAPSLTCIANYHAAGAAGQEGDAGAAHCDHRGKYSFPLSKEWLKWMKVSDEFLSKDEMAEFIDDNAKDLLDPTQAMLIPDKFKPTEDWEIRNLDIAHKIMGRFGQLANLIQMSREFQVHETSNLTAKTNRDTGETTFQFEEAHNDAAGRPLKIPNLYLIAIPVFESGDLYRLTLRFKYRKRGNDLKFSLSVYDPDTAMDNAFDEAVNKAATDTGMPLMIGSPEA